MAYALIDVPGGSTTYPVTFPYINKDHVKVMVNGVLTTNFEWINDTTISITPQPSASDNVRIYRNTSQGDRLVDYQAGQAPTETNLDADSIQAFYLAQESLDRASTALSLDPTDFLWDARGLKMKNVAPATDDLDIPLFGQIKPSVEAAEAAQAAAEEARDVTLTARGETEAARDAAAESAALAATFVPDNYYTEAETNTLLNFKASIADVTTWLAAKLDKAGGSVTGLIDSTIAAGAGLRLSISDNTTSLVQSIILRRGDGTGTVVQVQTRGDAANGVDQVRMNFSGGQSYTFNKAGNLQLGSDPSAALDAVTKQYADAIAAAMQPFESAEYAPTVGTNYEFAHGLTSPKRIVLLLRCKTAEHGYSVGDEISLSAVYSTNFRGPTGYLKANGTHAGIIMGTTGTIIPVRTTGAFAAITDASWKVIARVYRY